MKPPISAYQKLYDQLNEFKKETDETISLVSLTQIAVDLCVPPIREFYAGITTLVAEVSSETPGAAAKLAHELKILVEQSRKKLLFAKEAMIDSMVAAGMPFGLLRSLFLPERATLREVFQDCQILLNISSKFLDTMANKNSRRMSALNLLSQIGTEIKNRSSKARGEGLAKEPSPRGQFGHPKKTVDGRLASKPEQRKAAIIAILMDLEANTALMAKEIVDKLPKNLRITEGALRRHELKELSEGGKIVNTPGQGYHIKSKD